MKLNFILSLLLLFVATAASAYDFKVDGIYYNISGNNVYNRSGSLIGRVSRVPDLVAAIVYFYGYYPLR